MTMATSGCHITIYGYVGRRLLDAYIRMEDTYYKNLTYFRDSTCEYNRGYCETLIIRRHQITHERYILLASHITVFRSVISRELKITFTTCIKR